MHEERIDLGSFDERFFAIVGRADENLRFFADLFGVKVIARGTEIIVKGDPDKVKKITSFIRKMLSEIPKRHLSAAQVREEAKKFLREVEEITKLNKQIEKEGTPTEEVILITHRKKAIVPKTPSQRIPSGYRAYPTATFATLSRDAVQIHSLYISSAHLTRRLAYEAHRATGTGAQSD